jgi:hypothetical protein
MNYEWTSVREAARQLDADGLSEIRLSNLAIAASAAMSAHLLPSLRRSSEGNALRRAMETIAIEPLPQLVSSDAAWKKLASSARLAANVVLDSRTVDEWIEVTQAADAGRKPRGAYATPMVLARKLAYAALAPLIGSRASPRVIDPSAGAGNLLIAALEVLTEGLTGANARNIVYSLHGVELDAPTRELCCLLLWIAAAPGKPDLHTIAANIELGNAITRDWSCPDGQSAAFDVLLMNPPWESLRHEVDDSGHHLSERVATIRRLEVRRETADGLPPLFSMQGKGDRNLYKAFLELAPHLVRIGGRLGILIPGAFASDLGMVPLRRYYFDQLRLEKWTSFENLHRYFPIDGRYKFGLLTATRDPGGTQSLQVRSFAALADEFEAPHVVLSRQEIIKAGGNVAMLPEVTSRDEALTLIAVRESGTPFFGPGSLGKVVYRREVDLTLGRKAGLFWRYDECGLLHPAPSGSFYSETGRELVPVVEGRMVGQYDFFQKSWAEGRGRTAKWILNRERALADCVPQYLTMPRRRVPYRIALCDVTSATNTRTVLATWVPETWICGNTAPVLEFENERVALAGLAILNSMVFDWFARRVISGLHLNRFYLDLLAWPQLSSSDIGLLAEAGEILRSSQPRCREILRGGGDYSSTARGWKSAIRDSHVLVELTVARAFGLSGRRLSLVYDPDRSNRRGFWRYYAAAPEAPRIVEAVLRGANLAGNGRELAVSGS